MSLADTRQTLFEWYDKYVGEAVSRREVYGYWTFVLGYAIGILGVLVYLLGPGGDDVFFLIREIAIVLSAIGLALSLLGIVLQLPVRQQAVYAAVAGAALALLAVAYFTTAYPQNWLGPTSPQRTIIAAYILGVGVIAGVAVLVPVLTGERGYLLNSDLGTDSQAIMVGEAERGGLFAVFRRGPADWRWRLLEQDAIADGVQGFASRPDVESTVEDVKTKVREAGMLEITHAAFRIYGGDGAWQWQLMDDDGSQLATSAGTFPDRDTAEENVSVFKEYGPDATLLDVDTAAFDIQRAGTDWTWELLDDRRSTLATAPTPLDTRADADAATDRVRAAAGDADILALETLGFEVQQDGDDWTWRLLDASDTPLATATTVDDSRDAVRTRIDDLRASLGDAPVVDTTEPAIEHVAGEAGWRWRLTDDTDTVVATNHGDPTDADTSRTAIDTLQATVADADTVTGEGAAVELYRDDGQWHWRLVDDDRTVGAHGATAAPDREAVDAAVAHAADQIDVAELVEFEEAAFQLYEAENGDWRWRLIDEGGSVMTDSGEDYDSREAAASGMSVIKEHAPDAELLEIESAAIELFRTDDGEWGWRLVDESGETLAEAGTRHDSKADAKADATDQRDRLADAPTRVIGDGAFQLYERPDADGGPWRWRFIAAAGDVIADGATTHTTREGAERAVATVQTGAPTAPVHDIDAVAFTLDRDDDDWTWAIEDTDRDPLAESSQPAADYDDATAAVATVKTHAADATVFELQNPVFRMYERDDGDIDWTLIDAAWTPIATAPTTYPDRESADAAIRAVVDRGPVAGVLEYENAAYEVFQTMDEDWQWRLIDEDGDQRAVSASTYASREAATDALDRIRELIGAASILEIETASFELHEGDTGWRWRLVDQRGDTVAESARSYPTRTAAREGMQSLKDHAPEAGLVFAG